jgi:serine/threonine-protein kinase
MSNDPPTIDPAASTLRAGTGEVPRLDLEELARLPPFKAGPLIGKGGMGEVRDCLDARLDRHIALKTATTKDNGELSRFVREARVQGQLEHPSIVPVYELGVGADGAPWFAMKRVRGDTLFEVLAQLKRGEGAAKEKYPRRRLLQAFVAVCQAVDYAHTHGWIHRDLKPANVMLGDFGEVYVLDWGLARHLEDAPPGALPTPAPAAVPGLTTPGTLMGTPGYMAPEQVLGRLADARSDVYALGAILFELLTWQRLARGETAIELLQDTNKGCDARARQRAPEMDVAPELELACLKATEKEAAQRYATVRELHDAVDRVLAGERDVELRAEMAKRHTDAAKEAVARASSTAADELELRKTALRELGLALSLAPNHRPALEALLGLMATPVKKLPPELDAELTAELTTLRRANSRAGFFAFLGIALVVGLIARVQHHWPVWIFSGLSLVTAAYAAYVTWLRPTPRKHATVVLAGLASITFMSLFIMDGPLRLVPLFMAVNTASFASTASRRQRPVITAMGLVAVLAPLLGSWWGLLPESFRFVPEGLLLYPMEEIFDAWSPAIVATAFGGAIIAASLVVGTVRDTVSRLSQRNALQTWTLRQMLPPEASAAPAPMSTLGA